MIWSLNTNILILILTFDGIKQFHTKKKNEFRTHTNIQIGALLTISAKSSSLEERLRSESRKFYHDLEASFS